MKEIVKYTSYHLINVTTPGPGGGSEGKNDGTNSATSAENPNGLIVRARRKPVVPSGPLASFDTSENGCSGSDADLAFNRSRDRSRSGRSSTRSAKTSSFNTGGRGSKMFC